MNCMYFVADGSQLVTYVYNTDATVNSAVNSTYQYTCMVSCFSFSAMIKFRNYFGALIAQNVKARQTAIQIQLRRLKPVSFPLQTG